MSGGAKVPSERSDAPIDWSEVPDDSGRELRLVVSRLALFGQVITIISGSFFVWNAVLRLGASGYPLIAYLTSPANVAHLVAIAIAAAT